VVTQLSKAKDPFLNRWPKSITKMDNLIILLKKKTENICKYEFFVGKSYNAKKSAQHYITTKAQTEKKIKSAKTRHLCRNKYAPDFTGADLLHCGIIASR
jgi:hypothetical protein